MLKQQAKLLNKLLIAFDSLIIWVALLFSINYHLNRNNIEFDLFSNGQYGNYLWGTLIWIASIWCFGGYYSIRKDSYSQVMYQRLKAVFTATLIFSTGLFIFKSELFSSDFILLIFSTTLVATLTERVLILFFLHRIREKGYNYRQIIIVGSGPRAQKFADLIESHKKWGIKCIGFVDETKKHDHKIEGLELLGSLDDLEKLLENNVVDEVVFCLPRKWLDKLEKYVVACEAVGVRVYIMLDFFDMSIASARLSELEGVPLLCLESTPSHAFQLLVKRMIDIVVSGLFLILLLPLFLLTGLLIKINSKGSVFFGQERCGMNGRRFKMWKFRTMVQNADQLKSELEHLNEQSGPVFKIKKDPRLIRHGDILRKFSLDELPQLYNVLIGDMSIVGPRPPVPSEVVKYYRWQRRRLSLRPGLTCLWQVSGRNKVSFDDWVKLDLEYIDNWSLGLDLKIVLMTIPAVLKGTGV